MSTDFQNYVKAVNATLEEYCGISLEDLPDVIMLQEYFEDDVPPEEAAIEILTEAGFIYTQEFDDFTDADW